MRRSRAPISSATSSPTAAPTPTAISVALTISLCTIPSSVRSSGREASATSAPVPPLRIRSPTTIDRPPAKLCTYRRPSRAVVRASSAFGTDARATPCEMGLLSRCPFESKTKRARRRLWAVLAAAVCGSSPFCRASLSASAAPTVVPAAMSVARFRKALTARFV